MGRISKFAVICALAVTALVASTTAASASTGIGTASGTALTVTARGPATLAVGVNIICTVDVLLEVNSSIAKTAGASVGQVRAAGSTISNCNSGISGTIDANIPITYSSWGGTLPTGITSATGTANRATFTMTGGTVFGTTRCQYVGNLTVTLSGGGTSFNSGSFGGSVTSSGGRCITPGRVTSGTLSLYANAALGTTLTTVAIRLI